MSRPRWDDERAADERLLDAALGGPAERRAARARLCADPQDGSRLRAFERRLARARRSLRDAGLSPAREERLVQRVLAATTRRPAPRTSLPRALLPYLAAACVLVLLGGLAARSGRVAPPRETLAAAAPAEHPLEAAALDLGGILAQARDQLASSASARSRHAAPDAPAAARIELRLLEARAKGLRERRWDAWLRTLSLSDLGPLAQALWCEVQLDRYVLTGDLPPAWDRALAILEKGAQAAPGRVESSKLLAQALARAHTYGVAHGLGSARPGPRGRPREELWTSAWFDQLASAGREAGLADAATWRDWVDWRGR